MSLSSSFLSVSHFCYFSLRLIYYPDLNCIYYFRKKTEKYLNRKLILFRSPKKKKRTKKYSSRIKKTFQFFNCKYHLKVSVKIANCYKPN